MSAVSIAGAASRPPPSSPSAACLRASTDAIASRDPWWCSNAANASNSVSATFKRRARSAGLIANAETPTTVFVTFPDAASTAAPVARSYRTRALATSFTPTRNSAYNATYAGSPMNRFRPSSKTLRAGLSFLSYRHSSCAEHAYTSCLSPSPGALRARMNALRAAAAPSTRRQHRMYSTYADVIKSDARACAYEGASFGSFASVVKDAFGPSFFVSPKRVSSFAINAVSFSAHSRSYASSTSSYTAFVCVANSKPRRSRLSACAYRSAAQKGLASLPRARVKDASSNRFFPECHAAYSSHTSGKCLRDMSAWSYASATRAVTCGCSVSPVATSGSSACGLERSQRAYARQRRDCVSPARE
mmetsp:Transcript_7866/g.33469  ORF Transcript_7866/g.33469 Transcript_7866/m.33469 type:complete len:361 (-) Transcript_7866:764-1846(-)